MPLTRTFACAITLALATLAAHAQPKDATPIATPISAPLVGMVDEACPPPLPVPAAFMQAALLVIDPPTADTPALKEQLAKDPELAIYNATQKARDAQDLGQLCRYHETNKALAERPPRAVFIGDSITELWAVADHDLFNGTTVAGRGIGGQTSAQMLLRFHADVVALHPRVVHILAGTNDVAGNSGPTTPLNYKNNIVAMVEIARANGIAVVLGSIPPAKSFYWRPEIEAAARITELNVWLADYARKQHLGYVDYYSALVRDGGLPAEFGNDGVHPNRVGLARMSVLARQALAEALTPPKAATKKKARKTR